MPARHRAPQPTAPSDAMLKIGIPLFGVGVIAVLLDVVPFFFGAHDRPLWLNVVAVLALPIGLGLALIGLLRSARALPAAIGTSEPPSVASATPPAADPSETRSEPRTGGRGRHARALAGSQR